MDIKICNGDLKFKYRVSGIIIDNGKVLIEQYGKTTYCLPGGYVQIGENSNDAIVRELKEETNLDFEIVNFRGIIENFFTNKKGQKTHEIDFYYYLKVKNYESYKKLDMCIIEKGEYSDIKHHFKWINLKDLEQYNLLPTAIKYVIINDKSNFHFIIKE